MAARGSGLPRADRLRQARDFRGVSRSGRRAAGRSFVLIAGPTARTDGCWAPRLGLTVSRRVGNAVARNRVKRRVREWFRRSREGIAAGVDLVVIARAGAADLDARSTVEQLGRLVETVARAGGEP